MPSALLALAEGAFKAPSLTLQNKFDLEIQAGRELPLVWYDDWLNDQSFTALSEPCKAFESPKASLRRPLCSTQC